MVSIVRHQLMEPVGGGGVVGWGFRGYSLFCVHHRVHIFTRDETGLVCLPTQLERTLQLYW
jgi:hypothetical protein